MSVLSSVPARGRLFLRTVVEPLLLAAVRLYMAEIFFTSGWLKAQTYLNGTWATTLTLFAQEYKVPLLPAPLAAALGTIGEVGLSALLAFGLFGRFAALGLLTMTAVIQTVYPDAWRMHMSWALFLTVILVFGAGRLSLDALRKQ
jgi:putative oxidoreductase